MASLNFCAECNNLLYPEADNTNHVLMYACRNCPFRTEAENPLVFRNDLKLISKEQPGIIDELMTDPTLRRTQDLTCPNCGHTESVMFQDQSKRTYNKMIFFYVCCYCNHLFRDEPLAKPHEETD